MTLNEVARGIVVVRAEGIVIAKASDALDLIAEANYHFEAQKIAIAKALIDESFFVLSSGLAGEVLQKFVNYGAKVAIYGDYSRYTSKPLKDFIYESNQGDRVFFVATEEEAIERLKKA